MAAHGPLRTLTVQSHEDLADQPPKHGPEMLRRLLYHNAIHYVDLLRFFGGEVTEVQSHVACVEHQYPDCFTATLRFASGAHGRFVADHFAPGRHGFELAAVGARATSGPGLNSTELVVRGAPPVVFEPDHDDRRFKAGLWEQASAFLAGVRSGRQPLWPAPSLRDAYQTMLLIDRISQSMAGGDWWPRVDATAPV
jgi:predicted dehydrogenase